MTSSKFFNLLGLFSLVAVAVSYGPTPVGALDAHGNVGRRANHRMITKTKKRRDGPNGRCKPRTTTSLSSSAGPTSTPVAAETPAASEDAPTSTSTPAPAATSPVSTVTTTTTTKGGHGKGCLAWPNGGAFPMKPFVNEHVSYVYTWDANKPPGTDELGLNFIPMLWGLDQARIDAFKAAVKPGFSEYVAGFNEPQEPGQCNLSVDDAIQGWKDHIAPLRAQGFKLICPVTSSNPNGFDWVSEFLDKCPECDCDVIPLHWYDIKIDDFKAYVMKWYNKFKKPIAVTEYACQNFNDANKQCSYDEIKAFVWEANNWLNQQDFVLFHCPFGFMHDISNVNPANRMMGDDNQPNELGHIYLSA